MVAEAVGMEAGLVINVNEVIVDPKNREKSTAMLTCSR
jgi:hypothetical protein